MSFSTPTDRVAGSLRLLARRPPKHRRVTLLKSLNDRELHRTPHSPTRSSQDGGCGTEVLWLAACQRPARMAFFPSWFN
ncbi:hypothetical protein, partial [Streptomyces formicae]